MADLLTHKEKMDIQDKLKDIQQARSNYQIEKFVVGQHTAPEMQYYQLCVEAAGVQQAIAETELRIQKIKALAVELAQTGKKSDAIEAKIQLLAIPSLQSQVLASKRELLHFQNLLSTYPDYTRQDIEDAQKDYWENRLTRVAQLQMLSRQGGVDWAQLEAVYQAGIFETAINEIPTMSHLLPQVETKKTRKKIQK